MLGLLASVREEGDLPEEATLQEEEALRGEEGATLRGEEGGSIIKGLGEEKEWEAPEASVSTAAGQGSVDSQESETGP